MLASKMEEWKLDRAEMVDLFGTTRDEWMAADLDGWLAPNRMYDGIAPAMSHAMAADDAEVYIVTTKQARPPPPPPPQDCMWLQGACHASSPTSARVTCVYPATCLCRCRAECMHMCFGVTLGSPEVDRIQK